MKAADSKRMVKVFSFGDSNQWEVMGTGLISKDYIEVTQGEMLTITVRSKEDNSIIIKSKVLPDRTYKMQEVFFYSRYRNKFSQTCANCTTCDC